MAEHRPHRHDDPGHDAADHHGRDAPAHGRHGNEASAHEGHGHGHVGPGKSAHDGHDAHGNGHDGPGKSAHDAHDGHGGHGHGHVGPGNDASAHDAHGGHGHGHDSEEGHGHGHDSEEGHGHGLLALFRSHHHDSLVPIDRTLEGSARGIRALWLSLGGLGLTAVAQLAIAIPSGSVALLNDTLHNATDALTVLPLWVAFTLGRRRPSRRFPFGLGRTEDLAGVVVVLMIAASAAVAGWEAIQALLDTREVRHLQWVAGASIFGFVGNEAVARLRIRVGREIGSAALVADGLHARTDGISSLGVLAGAIGVWAGLEWADGVAGLGIALLILGVLREAATGVGLRLLDAVDPAVPDQAEGILAGVAGVTGVGQVRVRWIGHRLHAEAEVEVDPELSVVDAHRIAEDARHALLHDMSHLASAIIHADPAGTGDVDHHAALRHHDER